MVSSAFSIPEDTCSDAEVLIIGGGLAALTAALAVLEQGRKPAIISAAPIGRSGNTLIAGGGIASATKDVGNGPATFAYDLAISGKGLSDPVLIARLAEDSPAMLLLLEAYGVPLKREGLSFMRRLAPGHSVSRNIPTDWNGVPYKLRGGTFMAAPLARLKAADVPMVDNARAAELVLDDAGVAGVLFFDRQTGTCRFARSRRIIIATGGFGGLFLRNNNVAGIVGDGAALALKAGAELRDMEMVQFFPTMMYEPVKMTISNTVFGAGAVVRNSAGERFLSRYDPAGDTATRDSMAKAIFMEVKAGRGVEGCAYVDCSGISPEIMEKQFSFFRDVLARHGVNLASDWLKGTPCTHYTLGGVTMDEDGRTGVSGLYVAGEVSGGVHGVNRLGGAALMEVAVFGRRAGLAAATDDVPRGAAALGALPEVSGYCSRQDRSEAVRTLKTLMWEHVSLVRDGAGLSEALRGIMRLQEMERSLTQGKPSFFSGSLMVAEAVIKSALLRTESRGAHYRADFPETDPVWTRSIRGTLQNGVLAVSAH